MSASIRRHYEPPNEMAGLLAALGIFSRHRQSLSDQLGMKDKLTESAKVPDTFPEPVPPEVTL